jgi:hypothetical protein
MYPPAHDPAAIAYQQWLQLQQQQPAPQYVPPPPAYPHALPGGAPHAPQYMHPPPAFHPPLLSPAPRRPKQPRQQQQQPEPEGDFISLWVVLVSLLFGAAMGAAGEHHRLATAVDAGVSCP